MVPLKQQQQQHIVIPLRSVQRAFNQPDNWEYVLQSKMSDLVTPKAMLTTKTTNSRVKLTRTLTLTRIKKTSAASRCGQDNFRQTRFVELKM